MFDVTVDAGRDGARRLVLTAEGADVEVLLHVLTVLGYRRAVRTARRGLRGARVGRTYYDRGHHSRPVVVEARRGSLTLERGEVTAGEPLALVTAAGCAPRWVPFRTLRRRARREPPRIGVPPPRSG